MSSQLSALPRHSLSPRQAELVERLFAAAATELEAVGHEALTIRVVANRAGMSPATAYTYVASKDHLFAELFWRVLAADPGPKLTGRSPTTRLQQTIRHLTGVIAAAPATAAAATKGLLGDDPQVRRIRVRIGATIVDRFRAAIGPQANVHVLETVTLAFFGALLEAGMGLTTYAELGRRLDPVVAVIMEGSS